MNDVYTIDLTRALPPTLANDPIMLPLARTIAAPLQENIELARLTLIFHRIDELEEDVLDILARDMHVDWWDDSYPIIIKRRILKDSVRVHMRLGTKFAVQTALRNVFPHSEVEVWYEYGSTHHRFRIILDLTQAIIPADFTRLMWALDTFNRLTVHLDEISYQFSSRIEVETDTRFHIYNLWLTGTYKAGTRPRRNRVGGWAGAVLEIAPDAQGYQHEHILAGTRPRRNIEAELNLVTIEAAEESSAFTHRFGLTDEYRAGERPHRNTSGGFEDSGASVQPDGTGFNYESPRTGTHPQTNTASNIKEGGFAPIVETESFSFAVRRCGTSRTK